MFFIICQEKSQYPCRQLTGIIWNDTEIIGQSISMPLCLKKHVKYMFPLTFLTQLYSKSFDF